MAFRCKHPFQLRPPSSKPSRASDRQSRSTRRRYPFDPEARGSPDTVCTGYCRIFHPPVFCRRFYGFVARLQSQHSEHRLAPTLRLNHIYIAAPFRSRQGLSVHSVEHFHFFRAPQRAQSLVTSRRQLRWQRFVSKIYDVVVFLTQQTPWVNALMGLGRYR